MEFVTITGITLNRGKGRCNVIAYFNASICGLIELRGCSLIRTEKDGLAVYPPRLDKNDPRRGVSIIDTQLLNAMQVAARKAYRAIGGDDLPAWALNVVSQTTATPQNVTDAEAA